MRPRIPLSSVTRLGYTVTPFEPSREVHTCIKAGSALLPAGLSSVNVRFPTLQSFSNAVFAFLNIVGCTTPFAASTLRMLARHAILVARSVMGTRICA
jgi:hypothetical protein